MSESPDTPGRRAVNVMDSIRKDIVFKTPAGVPKRRSKQKVLEEEDYIEVIRARCFVFVYSCRKIMCFCRKWGRLYKEIFFLIWRS